MYSESGSLQEEIFEKAKVQRKRHEGFESGQKWGGIYHDDRNLPDLPEIQTHMWSQFHATNLLYPAVFPVLENLRLKLWHGTFVVLYQIIVQTHDTENRSALGSRASPRILKIRTLQQ